MTNLCNVETIKVLIESVDKFTQKELKELLDYFAFDSLININILDYDLLRVHVLLLQKIITNDLFYDNLKPVRYTLNFILNNLLVLEETHSEEILSWLLNLLKHILSKTKNFKHFKDFFTSKKGKFFEAISSTSKLSFFKESHVSDFTSIIYELLMIDGNLDEKYSKHFAEILTTLTKLKGFYEIVLMLEIVLKKFQMSSKIFEVFSLWLLKNGFKILVEVGTVSSNKNTEEIMLTKLLNVINFFYSKYETAITLGTYLNNDIQNAVESSIKFLSANSEIIISFFTVPNLRKDATKLYAYILVTQNLENSWDYFYKQLTHLPTDHSDWIHSDPELFLSICYNQCLNCRIMWPPRIILQVISSLIYSLQRYTLKPGLLKIICYIYPMLMADSITKQNAILGDDILIIVSRTQMENIFSLHVSQLNWILRRGEYHLKKAVICFWLKHKGDFDLLKKCIVSCKMQKWLINIIADEHLDSNISIKAAELIRTIEDPCLKSQIAKMIPIFIGNPMIFKRLMISNPGILEDKTLAMKLGELMSLIQVVTVDEELFGMTCDYSKNLVTCLKTDASIVDIFYRNPRNIMFMVKRMRKLKDEPAMKAMGLLKVLLLVQKRNHSVIDPPLEIEIMYNLNGSTNKVEKCLDVLHLLTRERLFIRLTPGSINSVYLRLFSLYEIPDLSVKSLICLTDILKLNNWLATSSSTNLFVEMQCSLAVNEKSWQEFIVFLGTFLKMLKKRVHVGKQFYFAHTGIVRNYIKRLYGLPQMKVNYLLKTLSELDQRKSTIEFF